MRVSNTYAHDIIVMIACFYFHAFSPRQLGSLREAVRLVEVEPCKGRECVAFLGYLTFYCALPIWFLNGQDL
jgi:hypothetical protein